MPTGLVIYLGCFRSEILYGGGAVEVCLGTERGKGGRDVGLRASRRFDNQAEWQLLVHLPSTLPPSSVAVATAAASKASRACLLPEAAFTLPLFLLTRLLPQSDGLGEAVSLQSLGPTSPAGFQLETHRAKTSMK